MAREESIPQQIELDENGLPSKGTLKGLTVSGWMEWIKARGTQFDVFTGQVLIGDEDPFGIIKDSVLRLGIDKSTENFAEGAFQLVRDILYQVNLESEGEGIEQELHFLSTLLELLASLPTAILQQSLNSHARFSEIYDSIIRAPIRNLSPRVLPRLLQAALRVLSTHFIVLPQHDLINLLGYPSTAPLALNLLTREAPEDSIKFFNEFFIKCRQNNKLMLVDYELRDLSRKLNDNEIRQFIVELSRLLDNSMLEELFELPTVKRLASNSLTLKKLQEYGVVRYRFKDFLGTEEKLKSSKWPWNLIQLIKDKASELVPIDLRIHEASEGVTWDELARAVREGEITPDPILLTLIRSLLISISPYGFVDELALVYIHKGEASPFILKMDNCSNLSDAIKFDLDIGTIAFTSAADELNERIRIEKIEKPVIAELYINRLVTWLRAAPEKRFLVVDVGLIKQIIDENNKINTQVANISGDSLLIRYRKVKYRCPLLVGFPFPYGDWKWGEVVRDVVDEVLYNQERIHEDGELAEFLRNAGIVPLTPETIRTFDEQKPLVDVDRRFYPLHALKNIKGASLEKPDVYRRFS